MKRKASAPGLWKAGFPPLPCWWPVLLAVSCLALRLVAGDLPTLEAEVGETVTPETMGGCSMRCTYHWTTAAVLKGGASPTRIIVLDDDRANTAWRDPGGGVGARLKFSFPEKVPAEMEGKVPFYGLDVINGDHRSLTAWKAAARLKKARLLYNGKALYDLVFPDSTKWEHVHFDDIMVRSGDVVTLEILETYPGASPSAPLAITEIILQGAH